ncbi:MAG: HutD family protein [Paracoccaceae bacterium]|nr:HutD family protein [Paracoccaceae bacterium]MDG1738314.1 HutD family protein [Paracoccaceae bacterium]MDG2257349.1 HutD family protein [Paracoccaceae bacterium]
MRKIAVPLIRHIKRADYQTKPWKNGKGTTHDILILPEGSDHSSFELRFALSPIVERGVFSSFIGADRAITLVKGEGLELQFDAFSKHLNLFESVGFDTGLAPIGTPVGGPVHVVNVMARRGHWDIVQSGVKSELYLECEREDLFFVFCLTQDNLFIINDQEVCLKHLDSVLISDIEALKIPEGSDFLYAHLKPSVAEVQAS